MQDAFGIKQAEKSPIPPLLTHPRIVWKRLKFGTDPLCLQELYQLVFDMTLAARVYFPRNTPSFSNFTIGSE